jgi:hypothetical protein
VEVSEAYHVTSSRRFEVLEKYGDNGDIKKAWENIRGNNSSYQTKRF